MPSKCQFEEDAFQQLVDGAIGRLTNIVTTPGRVAENALGYDAACLLTADDLVAVVGPHVAPHAVGAAPTHPLHLGITVNATVWTNLAALPAAKIPPFRLNLFVQYKSPVGLSGGKAAQWPHWQAPYFRYEMEPKQLAVMAAIDGSGSGALGCYCSPDFLDAATLWSCTTKATILDHAHFVRAQQLASHGCYTYQSANGPGKAFSEPEIIPREDFPAMLEQAIAAGPKLTFEEAALRATKTIRNAIEDVLPRRSALASLLRQLDAARPADETDANGRRARLLAALEVIQAFEVFYRTRVITVG
ncbi:hypothetical protein HNO88_000476 [Novosphingobium chloroacetimidivorans]|uniref:Uncharacterized protein n=1 Tax=Novosphingobium chloroacetimidivorans TaxID=1428314 RepID=A0A7W7K7H7_9SPHN|nr:hypothetical protein [Novosphingobium chloroacetimidivorans]MBB4857169.1 hypothetical protein [Novosphingobium chloroacetimidivorans]